MHMNYYYWWESVVIPTIAFPPCVCEISSYTVTGICKGWRGWNNDVASGRFSALHYAFQLASVEMVKIFLAAGGFQGSACITVYEGFLRMLQSSQAFLRITISLTYTVVFSELKSFLEFCSANIYQTSTSVVDRYLWSSSLIRTSYISKTQNQFTS